MEAPLHSKILMAILLLARKEGSALFIVSGFFCSKGDSRWAYEMPPFLHHVPRRAPTISASRQLFCCSFSPGFHRMDIPPFRVFFCVISMRGINRLVVAIRRISGFLLSSS